MPIGRGRQHQTDEDYEHGEGDPESGDPIVSDFRRHSPRAAKDKIYDALLDSRWHSAKELHDLVGGVEFLTAIADLVRAGYSINRNENSYTLLSRWPVPKTRYTKESSIELKVRELAEGVEYSEDEDLNFARLGDDVEESDESGLDVGSEDESEESDTPVFEDEEIGKAVAQSRTSTPKADDTMVIGDRVGLPARSFLTLKTAILAKSGAGKTSSGVVFAEELCRLKLPFVVIDPLGVWWGLRAPSDRELDGFPVLILGGQHGDVELTPVDGALAADLVTRRYPKPAIVDLSDMTPDEQHLFVHDFAGELYVRNRKPLHLFIDEADEFAPQKPEGQNQKLVLNVLDRLVRRGRFKGIGTTLISQRSAVLHKNVLSMTDLLVAMCSVSPPDLNAINGWLERSVSAHERAECLRSLPMLPVGGAYILGSGKLSVFKKVQFRKKETFDSSATPEFEDLETEEKAPPLLVPVDDAGDSKEYFLNMKNRKGG